jgi:hypothetical protein
MADETIAPHGHPRGESALETTWPRIVNLVLGLWLALSAFAWPHSSFSRTNAVVVGLLIAGSALGGLWRPALRWVNAVLAVWLALSTFAPMNEAGATMAHNAILALVVFLVSLVPSRPLGGRVTTART